MKNISLSRRKVAATDRIVNRKIEEQFTLKDATVYGGYNLYSDMAAQSGLDRLLEETFSGWKARWAMYNLPTVTSRSVTSRTIWRCCSWVRQRLSMEPQYDRGGKSREKNAQA